MIVRYWNSHQYKVSFLGIPKTGSSTVRATLGINPERDWSLKPRYKKTFTVIREPVERLASAFQEVLRRGTFRQGYERKFSAFIFSLRDHGFYDEHAAPMSLYFQPVERVFLLENLTDVWQWLSIEKEVKANISPPYNVELNDEARAEIYDLYGRDFMLYNNYKTLKGVGFSYKIGEADNYHNRFFELKRKYPTLSDMAVFTILEREYYAIFGKYKYSSYHSFKNQQRRRTKKS